LGPSQNNSRRIYKGREEWNESLGLFGKIECRKGMRSERKNKKAKKGVRALFKPKQKSPRKGREHWNCEGRRREWLAGSGPRRLWDCSRPSILLGPWCYVSTLKPKKKRKGEKASKM
jgi:hypothetical protein